MPPRLPTVPRARVSFRATSSPRGLLPEPDTSSFSSTPRDQSDLRSGGLPSGVRAQAGLPARTEPAPLLHLSSQAGQSDRNCHQTGASRHLSLQGVKVSVPSAPGDRHVGAAGTGGAGAEAGGDQGPQSRGWSLRMVAGPPQTQPRGAGGVTVV